MRSAARLVSEMQEVGYDRLLTLIATESRNVLVDFGSPSHAPYRIMSPFLNRIAQTRHESWCFVSINVDDQSRAASHFDVKALPTLICFANGVETHRLMGAVPVRAIDELLAALS
ncbi:MAG: thioredoxin family protein [Gammaproteobacteria bacterium]|nr:thioredoxin family protein [Gammaproteobacteria bacterium]